MYKSGIKGKVNCDHSHTYATMPKYVHDKDADFLSSLNISTIQTMIKRILQSSFDILYSTKENVAKKHRQIHLNKYIDVYYKGKSNRVTVSTY